ncbi:type III PLP-dependent enzyme [Neomegalonema sp.]|uniref:type III PLP-dependent enzyme n=1 Tax=Neomegalonema sp. TaxID=2039713 RepID=UPI00262E25B6|nr:type III PLP-dependent enzyme [Neomegalonema sp.]MDD2867958.1 type III PLP-dependent enzyme [Neomegalonema sp.]
MFQAPFVYDAPAQFAVSAQPEAPVFCLSHGVLAATAARFLEGFPGLTTYAVKANPEPAVVRALIHAGVTAFDVASPEEIRLVRAFAPEAPLHYHNPVKSRAEIRMALAEGVRVFAADCAQELAKILEEARGLVNELEISVRFRLPIAGAAYDFGSKFGADPEQAVELLRAVAAAGALPSLTFHPGSQCLVATAHAAYIRKAAGIAREAGVSLRRLNVGGGFPVSYGEAGEVPPLEAYFASIRAAALEAFGEAVPPLVCEPGRAMVADACALVTRVKLVRGETVFLNDGVYGGLAEAPILKILPRRRVISAEGVERSGAPQPFTVFGPTCDSLDRMPGAPLLPSDVEEGDFVIFEGLGAYGSATTTRFNGYEASGYAMVSTAAAR